MSPLVERALQRAGLLGSARARLEGEPWPEAAQTRLLAADLLVLGAIADAVRVRAVGDVVRFYEGYDTSVVWVCREDGADPAAEGLRVLRRVALLRVQLPDTTRVGVNYTDVGLELAQVALGFGASELGGRLSNKRGLPIADDATKRVKGRGQVSAQDLQREELATMLSYVGRRAVFAGEPSVRGLEVADETARGATHA